MSSIRGVALLFLGLAAACTPDVEPSTLARSEISKRPLPRLGVVQVEQAPKLDGSLADAVWRRAKQTPAFVETRNGGPAKIDSSAKLLWDASHLYVGIEVNDRLLRASDTERDAHLWEQDCVELMIDPDGDGKDYFEIQVSPRGTLFDTRFDARRSPRPFGHLGWDSGARVSVATRGDLDDGEADAGYSVELAIPWQAFSPEGKRLAAPQIGDEWRANLYVMDLGRDGRQAASWSPLGIGDFHVPWRFGILSFEGPPDDMQTLESPRGHH